MELHLGLALSTSPYESIISLHHSRKRKHDDDEIHSNSVFVHQSSNDNGGVIGWPPMKSWRKKLCHPKTGNRIGGMIGWPPVKICKKKLCYRKIENGDGGRSKSTYVKVHMEGVGIARKVDLNRHQSYQSLVCTLANMFDKCIEDVTLAYKDKEGAWLLAGDVPWGSFIKTVQRLRLLEK